MYEEKIAAYGTDPHILLVYRHIFLPLIFFFYIFRMISTPLSSSEAFGRMTVNLAAAICFILFYYTNKAAFVWNLSFVFFYCCHIVCSISNLLGTGPLTQYYLEHPLEDKTGLNQLFINQIFVIKVIVLSGILIFFLCTLIGFIRHRQLFFCNIDTLQKIKQERMEE